MFLDHFILFCPFGDLGIAISSKFNQNGFYAMCFWITLSFFVLFGTSELPFLRNLAKTASMQCVLDHFPIFCPFWDLPARWCGFYHFLPPCFLNKSGFTVTLFFSSLLHIPVEPRRPTAGHVPLHHCTVDASSNRTLPESKCMQPGCIIVHLRAWCWVWKPPN